MYNHFKNLIFEMVYKKLREECKKQKEKYKTDRHRIQKIGWFIDAIEVGDIILIVFLRIRDPARQS